MDQTIHIVPFRNLSDLLWSQSGTLPSITLITTTSLVIKNNISTTLGDKLPNKQAAEFRTLSTLLIILIILINLIKFNNNNDQLVRCINWSMINILWHIWFNLCVEKPWHRLPAAARNDISPPSPEQSGRHQGNSAGFDHDQSGDFPNMFLVQKKSYSPQKKMRRCAMSAGFEPAPRCQE